MKQFYALFLSLIISLQLFAACPPNSAHFCNVCVDGTIVANTGIFNNETVTTLNVTGTNPSTGCGNGAFIVAGGAGIGGNLNVCGTGTFNGPVLIANTTDSFACDEGALVVVGGVGIQGNLNVCGSITATGGFSITGPIIVLDPTQSTSCFNGAVAVPFGGVGIGGNLNVCGTGTFNGPVVITNTGSASGCTGGSPALTVDGGQTIAGDLGVGGNVNVCGQVTVGGSRDVLNNELRGVPCTGSTLELEVLGDVGILTDLYVCGDETIGGDLNVLGTFSLSGPISITNTTNSTACTNGALTVSGGVGIVQDLFVCGTGNLGSLNVTNISALNNLLVSGSEIISNTSDSNACNNGALVVAGGVGVGKNINVCGTGGFGNLTVAGNAQLNNLSASGPVAISNTTQSTACTNGALTVSGGVGIGGNLNVCGSVSGPVNYTYECVGIPCTNCTGAVARTVQSKLNDYWVDVRDFGAVGDRFTDDTQAIQAAINCLNATGGTIFFPSGRYLVTQPLNLTALTFPTRFVGTTPLQLSDYSACTIFGNTGGVLFDCTGVGELEFENIHIWCTGTNPSTIGFLFQRNGSGSNFVAYSVLKDVGIEMPTIPSANGGIGTVAVYNYAAEVFKADHCSFQGDSPLIIAGTPVNASFNSIYTTTASGIQSTTILNFDTCDIGAGTNSSVLFYDTSVDTNLREIQFVNCHAYWGGVGSAPTTSFAYNIQANIVDSIFTGQLELYNQFVNIEQILTRCRFNCNIGSASTVTTNPLIQLSDNATNGFGPGLWGCEISLWCGATTNSPLLQLVTNTRQNGVYDCDIYLAGTQSINIANGTSGGNKIYANNVSTIPTISQSPTGHGYLLFNASSTINFDGNLNLSGTGAYQQGGSFLVGQDVTLDNVAVGLGSFGDPALPKVSVTGKFNTAMGAFALENLTSGVNNSAFGYQALQANTAGTDSTAMGYQALANNRGIQNVAIGSQAMQNNIGGTGNIGIGYQAMQNSNTLMNVGNNVNVAIGVQAMQNSSGGATNVGVGPYVLQNASGSNSNVAISFAPMQNAIGSSANVAIGLFVMQNSNGSSNNVAIGDATMQNISGLSGNVAIGSSAMQNVTGASASVAIGQNAMRNAAGANTVAIGDGAMQNASGSANINVAIGLFAMQNSANSAGNVAIGDSAMQNATGVNNIAIGSAAMLNAPNSSTNVAIGVDAMQNASGATTNVAIGQFSMRQSTGAINSIAIGNGALTNSTGSNNVAIGTNALTNNKTGSTNIAIGNSAGSALTAGEFNDIYIGNVGVAGESSAIRIGTAGSQTTAYIAGIRGVTTGQTNAIAVLVDSNGQLGTVSSSRQYKKDIESLEDQSDKMLKLRPVSFVYKHDADNLTQYGLIAEEVNEVYPELVVHNDGQIYTVNYMALIPLLLKQIQELEQHNQIQDGQIAQLMAFNKLTNGNLN